MIAEWQSTVARLPLPLHGRLKQHAQSAGVSMNTLIMRAVARLLDELDEEAGMPRGKLHEDVAKDQARLERESNAKVDRALRDDAPYVDRGAKQPTGNGDGDQDTKGR